MAASCLVDHVTSVAADSFRVDVATARLFGGDPVTEISFHDVFDRFFRGGDDLDWDVGYR